MSSCLKKFDDFIRHGKPTLFMFAENKLVIAFHIEDPARSSNKLRFDSKNFLDCLRQTGSLRTVISWNTIGDANFHGMAPVLNW